MKNIFAIFFTILSFNALGQNQLIGVEGSLNRTNINSENSSDQTDRRNSVSFGLNYEYLLKSPFSIGAGLTYNQKGFKNKITIVDQHQNFIAMKYIRNNFDYISVPIKGGFTIGNKFFGFIKIGIIPSLLISAKTTAPTIDQNGETNGYNSVNLYDKIAKFELAGLGEIGCGYKLNNKYRLFASFGYQPSFTSTTTSEYFPENSIKNEVTSLLIGLKYLIKSDN